jgi:hypothetical protein
MRRTIETAPRDGNAIILEDNASGTYDVAHWSPEAGEWVGENGEPSKITPSHWHPLPGENYFQQGQDISSSAPATVEAQTAPVEAKRARLARWRFVASAIAATLVAAAIIGVYFRAEVAAYVTQYADQQDIVRVSTIVGQIVEQETRLPSQDVRKTGSLALQQQAKADQSGAQVKQAVEASAPEARTSLEKEQRIEVLANELAEARSATNGLNMQLRAAAANSAQLLGQERRDAIAARQELAASTVQVEEERARGASLANELAKARREIETQAALSRKTGDEAAQLKQAAASATTELRQSLQQEHDRAEALASELATARRDVETQAALSRKAGDEAAQLKQATESATTELRQSLQQEHDRAEALASELATARRDVETQAAQSRKAGDEAAQLKQATESTIAELRRSLQQERGRTAAMARDIESMRRTIDGRATLERAADNQSAQVTQAAAAATTEQPAAAKAAEAQGSPEATRLIARASALLGQGNIGAARIVLERAAETGSAQASFMLAETYDPVILSAWGTYGTRGEATKAREFYARAQAGGVQEAKNRFDALSQ